MGFWGTTAAAPSWLSTWFSQKPDYLRVEDPELPHIPSPYSMSWIGVADARAVATLWREHYEGKDWWFDADEELVLTYVRDPRSVMLGLKAGDSLVATIAAVPLGETTMSHGARLRDFYVVEGLVVHRGVRGKGVAGWMIAAIDGTMCRFTGTPFACLWAREILEIPRFPTFVSCRPYAWFRCDASSERDAVGDSVEESIDEFRALWESTVPTSPHIRALAIDNRRGGLRFFRVGTDYAVVSDTRRRTKRGTHRIYEIVWASSDEAVMASAKRLTGLLFTTRDMTGRQGWNVGNAGYHAYSIYNYRPPVYGNCDILAIREEL